MRRITELPELPGGAITEASLLQETGLPTYYNQI